MRSSGPSPGPLLLFLFRFLRDEDRYRCCVVRVIFFALWHFVHFRPLDSLGGGTKFRAPTTPPDKRENIAEEAGGTELLERNKGQRQRQQTQKERQ